MADSRPPGKPRAGSEQGMPQQACPTARNGKGFGRMIRALGCSVRGLRAAIATEAAFRQELALAAVLIPVAALAPFSPVERVMLMGSMLLVLVVELLNSAVEKTLDRVSVEEHPLTGAAKDMASAAVLIALLLLALTWLAIAGPVLLGMILPSA